MSDAPKKLLMLCDVFGGAHGGTEGQMVALARGLPSPWTATLWVLQDSDYLASHPFPCSWRAMNIPATKNPAYPRWLKREARRIAEQDFDLIHAFHSDTCVVAPILGRLAGVPVITSRRDQGYWQTRRMISVLRRANRAAARIISNSDAVARRTIDIEHALPTQLAVVGNGHDPARFETPPDVSLRERLNIPNDAQLIGLVANYRPLKRQIDLIDALANLRDDHPTAYVLFVGTGGGMHTLLKRARECSLLDRIRVHPVRGDVVPVVKNLDIGVLCSESEGLSNAIIEYMACRLPVVATNVGGNPELVTDGENGLLYAPGDVDQLASALARLLSNERERTAMGDASRRRFDERYTLRRMLHDTVATYEDVLQERKQPAIDLWSWREVVTEQGLDAIEDEWRALAGEGQFFCGPSWVRTWLRTGDHRPSVWIARDASGAVCGVMPLTRSSRGTLRFCGQERGADHLDVVAPIEQRAAIAYSWLKQMAVTPGWTRMVLEHVPEGAALRRALRLHQGKIPYGERRATVCPYIDTTTSWDEFLIQKFSRKRRHELRRVLRRFEEREGTRVVYATTPEETTSLLDVLFTLHRARFTDQGKETSFEGDEVAAFHRALATTLVTRDELFLAALYDGDKPLACYYGFRDGDKMYHFQSGIASIERGTSPGTILRAIVLRDMVFGSGLREFDFLDGDEAYKFQWATGVRGLYDLHIARPSRRGRARVLLGGIKELAKDEVKHMLGRK